MQQVQVRTLSADRRRRCEPAGAAGGLGERSQLAEGNRPIGLGAQRLERLLPRKTEATSARLVVGRKRCRRHWRWWKRQGCLDQSPYLDDGQPSTYGEAGLPRNAYYGDGTPFEGPELEQIREAYRAEAVVFAWRSGDLLMVDNMLTAHARKPYAGPRRVIVGMAESWREARADRTGAAGEA